MSIAAAAQRLLDARKPGAPELEVRFVHLARQLGVEPSMVTQLRQAGRLVLADDGRRVQLYASLALLAATADPAKEAVAARHDATKGQGGGADAAAGAGGEHGGGDSFSGVSDRVGSSYQASRAVKERFLALSAKRDYEISLGRLLNRDEVEAAVRDAGTQLRNRFEGLGALLAPQTGPGTTEHQRRELIEEAIEHALTEASRQLAALAQTESA